MGENRDWKALGDGLQSTVEVRRFPASPRASVALPLLDLTHGAAARVMAVLRAITRIRTCRIPGSNGATPNLSVASLRSLQFSEVGPASRISSQGGSYE